MSLATGTRLGPYEIVAPIGSGGMGEVYRAKDTRLGRDVAIKVLPAAVAADAERLARFKREAQVLASLNHPNIAAIHGLDEANGTLFLVLEIVEGEDLAARLKRGPIPVDEAQEIAKQIALALEEAHEKGIVHRDLKPANIKLTPDGRVKVLDFGLAKAYSSDASGASSTDSGNSPTLTHAATMAGMILGTAAYMSPEQARAKSVDKRADIWAFGVVVYEMLAGRQLFQGETVTDVLAAVIGHEPDWSALPAAAGPGVRRVLARCLEKNPKSRYRDIGDVALDVASAPAADATMRAGPGSPERSTGRAGWSIAVLASLLTVAVGALYLRQRAVIPAPPRFEKLTYAPQYVTNARFTPDGRSVVFSAARDGNTSELFVKHAEDTQPSPLGGQNVQLLSVSSKGELAVLTHTAFRSHRSYIGTLARMPIAGGAPREILNDVTAADWFPDGAELAVIRQTGGRSRLEHPVGKVLADSSGYLSDVRVSPKGDRIAYMFHAYEGDNRGPVVVIDRNGAVIAKSPEYWGTEGLTWSEDGGSVLFSAAEGGGASYLVHALAMNGTVREVLTDPSGIIVHDTTAAGRLLVSGHVERSTVFALFPGSAAEREFPWLGLSFFPIMSPDGRSVLYSDQSQLAGGNYAVYLQAADGSPPIRLGEGYPTDFSRDGASVLAFVPSDPPRLMIYPTSAGASLDVSAGEFVSYDYSSMHLSPDGHGAVFCGNEPGKPTRCYERDLSSRTLRALTPEGTDRGTLSPDGRTMVARGTDGRYRSYPQDGGEPVPVPGLESIDVIMNFRSDGRSLLVYRPWEIPGRVFSLEVATGQKTLFRTVAPADRVGAIAFYGVSFSADEKSYVYCLDRSLGALYAVEGVK